MLCQTRCFSPGELLYYAFTVNLDRCGEGYNTLNDSSDRLFILNNTEDINLQVFQNHNQRKNIFHASVTVDQMIEKVI